MALAPITPGQRLKSFPTELYNGAIDLLAKSKALQSSHATDDDEGEIWVVLTAASVVTPNAKWDYECKLWHDDRDSTAWTGGFAGGDTFKARNEFESDPANKGFYTASNVSGIRHLPLNKRYKATPTVCSAGLIYVVDQSNEPICS